MNHAVFILAWNEFTDDVLLGYCCRLCRAQLEVVRDGQGFSIGLLCHCSAATVTPYFAMDEMN